MSKRLFISKNTSEVEPYRSQFEKLGYSVISHSFLSFSALEFENEHPFEVIFFGSPRAVIFYLACGSLDNTMLIACVGGKTAELLESLDHEVSFVGERSGDPKGVAEEFKIWVGERRVLFPVSDRSLKTISSVIDDDQKEEVVVYSTEVVGKKVEESDVYVFTSPSNVEGFLMENALPEKCEVVAWGKSTEAALISHAASVNSILKNASFEDLIDYFKSL